jgi:hypothetical protein
VSDVIAGIDDLATLKFGGDRQNLGPHLGWVARHDNGYPRVSQQQPPTLFVVCQYLGHTVGPALKQLAA